MRILLINSSPVVGKLVTLSAQKTGDELTVLDNIENVPNEAFELLLIDDEFFSDDNITSIEQGASFEKKVLIANRGEDKPDGFTMLLEKPFLPTDLVEVLLSIAQGDEHQESDDLGDLDGIEGLEDDIALDASSDDDLLSQDTLDTSMDEASDDDLLEGLEDMDDGLGELDMGEDDLSLADLGSLEENSEEDSMDALSLDDDMSLDEDMSLDAMGESNASSGLDDLDSLDASLDALEEESGGVLAQEDISEVKELLDEEGVDDSLELDDGDELDALEESDISSTSLEDDLDALSLDDEALLSEANEEDDDLEGLSVEDDLALDSFGDDVLEEVQESATQTLELEEDLGELALDDDMSMSAEDRVDDLDALADELDSVDDEEDALLAVEHSEDSIANDLLEEVSDISDDIDDMDSIESLSLESEDDVESDDPLMDDEELMLEEPEEPEEPALIVAGGEFASLTEEALSEALGEKMSDEDESSEESDFPKTSEKLPEVATKEESVDTNNAELLKALLGSLDSKALQEALKGKKISINITIGE